MRVALRAHDNHFLLLNYLTLIHVFLQEKKLYSKEMFLQGLLTLLEENKPELA